MRITVIRQQLPILSASCIVARTFSTTSLNFGKKNFRKFRLWNPGTEMEKKKFRENPDPKVLLEWGIRPVGEKEGRWFKVVPERIPELVVPDLKDFNLKPYVSYRVAEVTQSEFTAQNLFDAVYTTKIAKDYQTKKLDENGNAFEPSEDEKLTPELAAARALQTGTDLFGTDKNMDDLEHRHLCLEELDEEDELMLELRNLEKRQGKLEPEECAKLRTTIY